MNYRDERDALRGRVEGLEQELEDARRSQMDDAAKQARIAQIEARMRETEANMNVMRRELGALRGNPPAKKNLMPLWIGIAMVFVGALMSAFLLVRAPAPPPPIINVPTVVTAVPVPPPIPAIPEETAKPAVPVRKTIAQWTGRILRSNAAGLAPGAACLIDASLESEGDKQRVSQLTVKCADKVIYNSSDKLEGMSMMGSGMAELPGKKQGTFEYSVSFNDTGARAGGRTQVSLDTTHKEGSVWSEVVPMFRVDFSVAERSAPVQGEPLVPNKFLLENYR